MQALKSTHQRVLCDFWMCACQCDIVHLTALLVPDMQFNALHHANRRTSKSCTTIFDATCFCACVTHLTRLHSSAYPTVCKQLTALLNWSDAVHCYSTLRLPSVYMHDFLCVSAQRMSVLQVYDQFPYKCVVEVCAYVRVCASE